MLSFKNWFWQEDKVHSLGKKHHKHKEKPEDYIDGMGRELGISTDDITKQPTPCGAFELEDQGLWFNQAIWQILPFEPEDHFVTIKFVRAASPNLDQQVRVRREDGKMVPIDIDLEGKEFLVTRKKLAEILSQGFSASAQQQQASGGAPSSF